MMTKSSNGEFKGATKQALKDINDTLLRIEGTISNQDTRIDSLEKWRWILTGATGTLGLMNWPDISRLLAFGG